MMNSNFDFFFKFLKQLFQPLFVRMIDPKNIIFIKKQYLFFLLILFKFELVNY